jgi:hypothetical protein
MDEEILINEILAAETRVVRYGKASMSELRDRLQSTYGTRTIYRNMGNKSQEGNDGSASRLTVLGLKEYLRYLFKVSGKPKKRLCATCGNLAYNAAEKAAYALVN